MTKPRRVRRGVERTKLLMCEGITDKRFADCLKRLLTTRAAGFSVRLDDAGGGGPKSAIMAAINHAGGFDKRVVFIDSDLAIPNDALAAARNNRFPPTQSFCKFDGVMKPFSPDFYLFSPGLSLLDKNAFLAYLRPFERENIRNASCT